ncbi:MAG: hypothetical protein M1817_004532 [Caeruleum heppii]|nr:MAG: hypothetical protein M1817_004532 [Caeruleum heppii]
MALIRSATESLDSLSQDMQALDDATPGVRKASKLAKRKAIALKHLAYTQMFGADVDKLSLVTTRWHRLLDNVENLNAQYREGQLLYLTASARLHDLSAGNNRPNLCDGGTEAVTLGAMNLEELNSAGINPVPVEAFVINFCPRFFEMTRMSHQLYLLDQGTPGAEICRLDRLDVTARVALHEMTHLPWTLNSNLKKPIDTCGFFECAQNSVKLTTKNQTPQTDDFSISNADSHAWMAIYNYFNSLDKCAGVQYRGPNELEFDCTDAWPSGIGKDKPVRWTWEKYS